LGLIRYAVKSELCEITLAQDLRSVKRALGNAYDEFVAKRFSRGDVRNYYTYTTDRDYWLLEKFVGPGLHSCMTAPHPIKKQGGGTRQPAFIFSEVRAVNAKRVLEVGCGRGHCSLFLAGVAQDVEFEGFDLVPRHVSVAQSDAATAGFKNVSFAVVDVTKMIATASKTYDLIFGCESLCHMDDELAVEEFLQSATPLLRAGGRFVIIDGFRTSVFDELTSNQRDAMLLAESGFRIRAMPSKELWKRRCQAHGFGLVRDIDMTQEVLPFWTLGWRVARVILLFPFLVRLLLRSSPQRKETVANFLSVTMTAHAMRAGSAEYGMLVFEKL
jgi:2-polyprenyl-3-methyl-5-hydroxy-6-metoxy-1,4-benzoquinol methylase